MTPWEFKWLVGFYARAVAVPQQLADTGCYVDPYMASVAVTWITKASIGVPP
jgi:hypothetical protein